MAEQLPLAVNLPDDETFSSFIEGENSQLIGHLNSVADTLAPGQEATSEQEIPFLTYISGDNGSGKSHLLYALCHRAASASVNHIYLNASACIQQDTAMLDGLESVDLICIDDLQVLEGNKAWQIAVFDLINRVKEGNQSRLVVSADSGPASLPIELPDLQSRLAWGVSFSIHPLNDDQRCQALIHRAEQRGLNMTHDIARFLITHSQRDMPHLMSALQVLDESSLKAQRKLTIPFVKQVLEI